MELFLPKFQDADPYTMAKEIRQKSERLFSEFEG